LVMSVWRQLPTNRLLAEFSLWSADLTRLGEEIRRTERYADLYHIDVADAHFVPGLLFFPDLVAALRPLTTKPFHVHLMADTPLALIDDFVAAGADIITTHVELGSVVPAVLQKTRDARVSAGLAIKLETPLDLVQPYLDQIEVLVMMGTPLGVKGQDLSSLACPRIQVMRSLLDRHRPTHPIRVVADGGIRRHTVPALRAAGADGIVPGSLVFRSDDLDRTIAWLRSLSAPADTP
jgi:ribulose-phosphate 3-epimerase